LYNNYQPKLDKESKSFWRMVLPEDLFEQERSPFKPFDYALPDTTTNPFKSTTHENDQYYK